jgi:hypothetical protein
MPRGFPTPLPEVMSFRTESTFLRPKSIKPMVAGGHD